MSSIGFGIGKSPDNPNIYAIPTGTFAATTSLTTSTTAASNYWKLKFWSASNTSQADNVIVASADGHVSIGAVTNASYLFAVGSSAQFGVDTAGNVTSPNLTTLNTTQTITGSKNFTGGLTVATGTSMTGNQGNGALVQHSTGSVTSGHMAVFDANGNTVDGGAVPALTAPFFGAGTTTSTDVAPGAVYATTFGIAGYTLSSDRPIYIAPLAGYPSLAATGFACDAIIVDGTHFTLNCRNVSSSTITAGTGINVWAQQF
jgi:hypothetical protein